ncbi:tail fiber domain-containing protein [Psychroserpens jangbogonensis]|uniref:tail fiber domain-containing protein n=1 Tax=Psychroserpens jangbogonensis TaxID=1484460 RepID=UPI00053EB7FE|nr:tail fiber domain-containing protein [Psychroserpens jangbogonensis]
MRALILLFFLPLICFSQVGINTTSPNASLDIQSSNQATPANTDGILIPKIDEYPSVNPTAAQDGILVFATGTGSVTKGFYYWDNITTSWKPFSGTTIEKIDDLIDGKSDNDGTDNGSSIFLGKDAGLNDDGTNNGNVGIGFETMKENISGSNNSSFGLYSMYFNESGSNNVAIGGNSLIDNYDANNNTAVGYNAGKYTNGSNNVFLGSETGALNYDSKEGSVFVGYQAGYSEGNSNRLYIENSSSATPLIYGEFDNDLLRVNGDFEVEKTTDANITVKTPFGETSSLKLFESGGSGDYGFEFQYDGDSDKFHLWSRTFAGNEGIRMTWLKNGKVGINDIFPMALLDIEATNSATPTNTDGILIPRIDTFPASNPTADQNGMLAFLTTDNTFYFWRNSTTSWISINTSGSQSINDLTDGKSDDDGTDDGSSIFLGVDAGLNDDQTNNKNVGIGYFSMKNNTTGYFNTAIGASSMQGNLSGRGNTAVGFNALSNNIDSHYNVAVGHAAGALNNASNNVFLGAYAGYWEANSNRLHIESSLTTTPLIYGEFDNDLLRVNGDLEVEKSADASITVKTPFGNKSSLKLFESGGSGDYGFEFEYDGSPDKLYLWSRTFAGNEGIRMTWLKDGRVGINDISPTALLDIEATNSAIPSNTDGILIPRVDAFPAINPTADQNGMLLFLTTDNTFYYWKNSTTSWVSVSSVQKINDLSDGKSDDDGTNNGSSIFLGIAAGANDNSSDNKNTAVGYNSLTTVSIGSENTAVGYKALELNTSSSNTAVGYVSLFNNASGTGNTAVGNRTLVTNTSGSNNVSIGYQSMFYNNSGNTNVAIGFKALQNNITGDYNVAIGSSALSNCTAVDTNTAIGVSAASSNAVFDNITALGYDAEPNSPNQVRLGNASVSVIGGSANWSNFSDGRLKTNIKEDIAGLDFIKKLRPVSYNLDMNAIARFEKTPDSLRLKDAEKLKALEVQTGFIAQEVEAAANEVGFDFHGIVKPYNSDGTYALRYSEFVVPLVKAMQEQQDIIEAQKEELKTIRLEIEEIKALLRQD